jgi:hypothetical protein
VRAEIDASGSGKVYRVWADNMLLWAHPSHIDGPLSHEARRLFVALGGPDE